MVLFSGTGFFSLLAPSSLGCGPHFYGSAWLTTTSTFQPIESGKGTMEGSLLLFKGKEFALTISTHIPLVRTWSYEYAQLQKRMGIVMLILGDHVLKVC